MGGLRKKLPWTYWTFLISTLAIAGFPPFAGFFSKDEILWKAMSSDSAAGWAAGWVHLLAYGMGLLAAGITSFYMFRLVFLTFHGKSRLDPSVHVHHESPVMSIPLAVLAGLAIVGGWVGASLFGVHAFKHFLDPVLDLAQQQVVLRDFAHSHGAEWAGAGVSVLVALIGLLLARSLYLGESLDKPRQLAEKAGGLYRLVQDKYRIDELYQAVVLRPIYHFSMFLWKVIDEFFIDRLGVNGPPWLVRGIGGLGRLLHSGNVQVYAFWLFVGLSGAFAYLVFGVGLL